MRASFEYGRYLGVYLDYSHRNYAQGPLMLRLTNASTTNHKLEVLRAVSADD